MVPKLLSNPFDRGPLISPAAKERVCNIIESVDKEGGTIHLDGRRIEVSGYADGNFVGPTIVEATVDMRCYKQVIHLLYVFSSSS